MDVPEDTREYSGRKPLRMVTPPFTSRAVTGVVVWIPKLLLLLNVKFALPRRPFDVPSASRTVPVVYVPAMVPPPPPPVNATPFTK